MAQAHCQGVPLPFDPLDQEKLNNAKLNSLETPENDGAEDSNGFNVLFAELLQDARENTDFVPKPGEEKNRGRIPHLLK